MSATTNTTTATSTTPMEQWRIALAVDAATEVASISDLLQRELARIHEQGRAEEAQALRLLAARLETLADCQCSLLSDEDATRDAIEEDLFTPAELRARRNMLDHLQALGAAA